MIKTFQISEHKYFQVEMKDAENGDYYMLLSQFHLDSVEDAEKNWYNEGNSGISLALTKSEFTYLMSAIAEFIVEGKSQLNTADIINSVQEWISTL